MELKTGDPYHSGMATALTPLNVMPLALRPLVVKKEPVPPESIQGKRDILRNGDNDAIGTEQIDEIIAQIFPVLAPGSTLATAWNALIGLFGGLYKIPNWVYIAIMAGISLLSILNARRSGEVVRPAGEITGGKNGTLLPPGYDIRGPGVKEPAVGTYYNSWRTTYELRNGQNGYVWFWAMNDGYIICQNSITGRWKRWKPVKPIAVLGRKMNMTEFLKADRFLDRFARRLAKRSSKLKLQRG